MKWQGYDNPKDRTWEPEENMYARRANRLRPR